ncbi:MAG: hypothetical protein ACM3KD_09185 [Hyphomicrobiaceae bacterium]
MRALRLDYQRRNDPLPWAGVGLLVVTLAALIALGGHYRALSREAAVWDSKADRIERQSRRHAQATRPLTEQQARAQALEVKQANQVLRQLTLPWNAMFEAVEASGGKDVALLSLEPDVQKGVVKITGEAKNLAALLDYAKRLAARKVFSNVFLENHKIQQTDPEKPLHFTVLVVWKEGAA